jgi:hypothetical protein
LLGNGVNVCDRPVKKALKSRHGLKGVSLELPAAGRVMELASCHFFEEDVFDLQSSLSLHGSEIKRPMTSHLFGRTPFTN